MNTTLNPSMWGPPVVNKDGAAMRGHTTIPIMGGPSVPTLHQQAWSPPGHARPAFGGTAIMKKRCVSRNTSVNTFRQGSWGSPGHTTATTAPSASIIPASNNPLLVPPPSPGHTTATVALSASTIPVSSYPLLVPPSSQVSGAYLP